MNSVTFFGRRITQQQIAHALKKCQSEYPDTNKYDRWLEKRTYKYAVRFRGRRYPPKFILSLASGFDRSDFSGGEQTHRVFRRLGFEIIDKPSVIKGVTFLGRWITEQQILDALKNFESQYPDTNNYDRWLEKRTYKYAVRYRGKLYPPKYVLSLARAVDRRAFGGGQQTNSRFEKLGFAVIDKPREREV